MLFNEIHLVSFVGDLTCCALMEVVLFPCALRVMIRFVKYPPDTCSEVSFWALISCWARRSPSSVGSLVFFTKVEATLVAEVAVAADEQDEGWSYSLSLEARKDERLAMSITAADRLLGPLRPERRFQWMAVILGAEESPERWCLCVCVCMCRV